MSFILEIFTFHLLLCVIIPSLIMSTVSFIINSFQKRGAAVKLSQIVHKKRTQRDQYLKTLLSQFLTLLLNFKTKD